MFKFGEKYVKPSIRRDVWNEFTQLCSDIGITKHSDCLKHLIEFYRKHMGD